MRKLLVVGFVAALAAAPVSAQETIANPAIDADRVAALTQKISDLEEQLAAAKEFVGTRKTEVVELSDKIKNADADTQRIIDDLKALVEEFKTGSEIQLAVEGSMQDVKGYIDKFRAGTAAQQAAAASLQESLGSMEETDAKRNDLVGKALSEIRRLEANKEDLVALRIAGAFGEMAKIYDQMVAEFEATVNQTIEVSDSIESMTQLPVQ
ncbi:MAG: hypothetical protein AAF393_07485 [Pseudomonadota bacterium]